MADLQERLEAVPQIKRIKVLSMGEAQSGKSCIIKRYCEGRFIADYIPTIGIDYGVKGYSFNGEESS